MNSWTDREPEWALYLIEPPAAPVVSLDEMKQHLRVGEDNDDDDLIEAFTAAVIDHLDGRDGELARCLVDQTWELRLAFFPGCGVINVPLPPLIEVLSVKYIDANGAEQTYDSAKYHVVGVGAKGRIQLKSGQCWPALACNWPEPVIVQFRAGYIDGSMSPPSANVPEPIITAIKLLTANLYEIRQTVVLGQTAIEMPWAAQALLQRYRVYA